MIWVPSLIQQNRIPVHLVFPLSSSPGNKRITSSTFFSIIRIFDRTPIAFQNSSTQTLRFISRLHWIESIYKLVHSGQCAFDQTRLDAFHRIVGRECDKMMMAVLISPSVQSSLHMKYCLCSRVEHWNITMSALFWLDCTCWWPYIPWRQVESRL